MRDLERLQDVVEYRVSPGQLRLVFLGVLAVTCAIFAVGVSVGKKLDPGSALLSIDPLAELDRTMQSNVAPSDNEDDGEEAPPLTYHNELTDQQRRAVPNTEAPEPAAEDSAAQKQGRSAPQETAESSPVQTEPARPEKARPGEDSVFTLQVASFETQEEAQEFAADLRTRGHPIFLVRTGTPERGTWYRIRVGPFHSRREATTYQSRFERRERLPTFLVQRRR